MILKLTLSLATVVTVGLGMQLAEPRGMRPVDDSELEDVYGGTCLQKLANLCGDGPPGCELLDCDLLSFAPCLRQFVIGTQCGIEACGYAYVTKKCAIGGD